jgi:hypothetical protein
MRSERTATHYYPAPEVTAMTAFYGGKNLECIISERTSSVTWSHMLNAPLGHSNRRVRPTNLPFHILILNTRLIAPVDVGSESTRRENPCARCRSARKSGTLCVIPFNQTLIHLTMAILVSIELHMSVNARAPYSTLYLHEDLLARTFALELELKQ